MPGRLAAILFSPALWWPPGRAEGECTLSEHAGCVASESVNSTDKTKPYFWSQRGGSSSSSSYTQAPAISSISSAWEWKNELDEQVRHSPLIDGERNIYLQTATRVRKFAADGRLLWLWEVNRATDGKMTTAPVLYNGLFVLLTNWAHGCEERARQYHSAMIALSIETGSLLWRKDITHCIGLEAASLFVEDEIFVFGVHEPAQASPDMIQGTQIVVGMNASSREELWQYYPDDTLWNFMPSSVGDGSIMFSSTCGAVYRINLTTGVLIWQGGSPNVYGRPRWCGTGGGVVGRDGNFYAEYNEHWAALKKKPWTTSLGHVAAFRVSDGRRLWDRAFGHARIVSDRVVNEQESMDDVLGPRRHELGGWQYPSVGVIDGRVTVVCAAGGITVMPQYPFHWWAPEWLKVAHWLAYLHIPWYRRHVVKPPELPNEVIAFDAESGAVMWRYAMPVWNHWSANSDERDAQRRFPALYETGDIHGLHTDCICLPDNQGIPVISGDGSVVASDSHEGALYVIKDKNKDGLIMEDEVVKFVTNNEFLNSPSLAPGMVVAAPCWGNAHVFLEY